MTAAATTRARVGPHPERPAKPVRRWEVAAVGLATSLVVATGVAVIARDAPLLWDEAVYSLRVRDLIGAGVRGRYWLDVRAPGLPLLLTPAAGLFGVAVEPLRAASLAFAAGGVGLTWLIARLTVGPAQAAVAAGLLAIAPGWHDSSWQVMPDIPGAVLTLAAVAVVLLTARAERLSWWALAAAPLAGLATLVRYGAPLLIGPALVAAGRLRWPALRTSRIRAAVVATATAALAGAVWFVPSVTGAGVAPVLRFAARQDAKAIPALESAADFSARLAELVGPVLGPLVLVGGAAAVVAAAQRRTPVAPVAAFALVATSVLGLLLFGLAEYHLRYLTPALPFLAMLAAVGVVHLAGSAPPRAVTAFGLVVVLAGGAWAIGATVHRSDGIAREFGPVRVAYRDIAAATDPPCVVVDDSPAAEWYTGCAVITSSRVRELADLGRADVGRGEAVFAVVRHWPTVANPLREDRQVLERLAIGEVPTAPSVTVLELGTAARVAATLAALRAAENG